MSSKPTVPSDLDIAQAATLEPVEAIAEKMGLERTDIEIYGDKMAKVKLDVIERFKDRPNAKYILVTAITPTPLGEGKSTTTVGLGQAMPHIGKTATIAIRQPASRDRRIDAIEQVALRDGESLVRNGATKNGEQAFVHDDSVPGFTVSLCFI